ncbi:hypothetical protein C8F01DRAFT_1354604 [Mycena amicta]|nr:hypothetical protein C8F01DRAFT_1354604 [Mycena amicta]
MRPIQLVYIALAASFAASAPIPTSQALEDSPSSPVNPDSAVALPPVDEVFAIMAANTATQSLATPTATNAMHPGLGLVSTPPAVDQPSASPTLSAGQEVVTSRGSSPLAHRLTFVLVVILSMVAVIIAVYAISYHRHKLRMNRLDGLVAVKKQIKEKEKESLGRCSVVDISRNFPRSKFSVTSSDYPISTRISYASTSSSGSSESESTSDCDSQADAAYYEQDIYEREQERGRMMNVAHLFALRSSSMAASPPRHSRFGSAPVFGVPRFDQSRRSRSVSGGNGQRI